MPGTPCKSISVVESLMSFEMSDVPPGFEIFCEKYVSLIPCMFAKGMELDSMEARKILCSVLKCGEQKHTATFLWIARDTPCHEKIDRFAIPEGALQFFCIRVSPRPAYEPITLSVCIKKLVDKHMPPLNRKCCDNIAMYAEDKSVMINWNIKSDALVVENGRHNFRIIRYSGKYDSLPKTLAGHCSMSSCDKWILEKDNHFYFINRESARHVMSISCSGYPNVQWIKQEEAREAALFKAFISGTHQRLGEASVLLKYLSTCVVPLYEVFIEGCIREASFHLQ
jgi:hypothetical protein